MNLSFAIGEHSPLWYDVYCSLVRVAGQTDNTQIVLQDLNKVCFSLKILE